MKSKHTIKIDLIDYLLIHEVYYHASFPQHDESIRYHRSPHNIVVQCCQNRRCDTAGKFVCHFERPTVLQFVHGKKTFL